MHAPESYIFWSLSDLQSISSIPVARPSFALCLSLDFVTPPTIRRTSYRSPRIGYTSYLLHRTESPSPSTPSATREQFHTSRLIKQSCPSPTAEHQASSPLCNTGTFSRAHHLPPLHTSSSLCSPISNNTRTFSKPPFPHARPSGFQTPLPPSPNRTNIRHYLRPPWTPRAIQRRPSRLPWKSPRRRGPRAP